MLEVVFSDSEKGSMKAANSYNAKAMIQHYRPILNARKFGNAGQTQVSADVPLDQYPDPNDPKAQMLYARDAKYKEMQLPVIKEECSRYTGYVYDGKLSTGEMVTAKAKSAITFTDVNQLNSTDIYTVQWDANPTLAKRLLASNKSISHTGVYYDGYVWHKIKDKATVMEFNLLNRRLANQGYTVGPTFRMWW